MRAQEITENIAGRNRSRVYDLLVNTIGSGPFDGGCVIIAQAIQQLVGGDIVVLVGNTRPNGVEQAQHAAVKIGDRLVDFDGVAPVTDFVRRFERNELAHTGGEIAGIREIQPDDLPEAPRDAALAAKLARMMS